MIRVGVGLWLRPALLVPRPPLPRPSPPTGASRCETCCHNTAHCLQVFSLSDKIIAEQKTLPMQPSTDLYVLMLVNEVCLFVLQTAREKNAQLVTNELTTLFLQHEKRWQHKYIAVNFIRLRLINMQVCKCCVVHWFWNALPHGCTCTQRQYRPDRIELLVCAAHACAQVSSTHRSLQARHCTLPPPSPIKPSKEQQVPPVQNSFYLGARARDAAPNSASSNFFFSPMVAIQTAQVLCLGIAGG